MLKKLSHVGVAVQDLKSATKLFSKLFQIDPVKTETVVDQKIKLAFFIVGDTSIELTEATSPDSPIARFIEKRGDGVHHLALEVDDIDAELARLKKEGFQLIDEQPRLGAEGSLIAFIHPKSTNGVLIELSQRVKT